MADPSSRDRCQGIGDDAVDQPLVARGDRVRVGLGRRGEHVVAVELENLAHELAHLALVLDDEDGLAASARDRP